MAIPGNLSTKTVTGTFIRLDTGAFATGIVTFTPNLSSWLLDPAATVTLVPTPSSIQFSAAGFITTTLACTDDPDVSPVGWTWHCKIVSGDVVTEFDFALPTASPATVDLSQVASVVPPAALLGQVKSVNGVFPDVNGNVSLATVAPTNLDDLADVVVATPLAGDVVLYDPATSKWARGRVPLVCTLGTRPATAFVGMKIYETDTRSEAICVSTGPNVWQYTGGPAILSPVVESRLQVDSATFTTTEVNVWQLTFTSISTSARYDMVLRTGFTSTTANAVVSFRFRWKAGASVAASDAVLWLEEATTPNVVSGQARIAMNENVPNFTAGQITVGLFCIASAGTGKLLGSATNQRSFRIFLSGI